MEKLDLTDCTFIIPIKLDSEDREKNFRIVLKYLHDKFKTNIIILESYHNEDLIIKNKYEDILNELNATILERPNEKYFHRTRYLNEMLNLVKTKVTINYDIDVFLSVQTYLEARDKIINEKYDLVYPFSVGDYQLRVPQQYRDELVNKDLIKINIKKLIKWRAEYGNCQFFNTESYKKGFGENENFISHAPEDYERFHRFNELGFKVTHLNDKYIFHLEHERGRDSGSHMHLKSNIELYEYIKKLSKKELLDYYNKQKYYEKYSNWR